MPHVRGSKPSVTLADVSAAPNARPQRLRPDRPAIPKSDQPPAVPSWLTLEQRQVFKATLAAMVDAGLQPIAADSDLVVAYSVAVCLHRQAAKQLASEKLLLDSGREIRRNPLLIVIAQQTVLIDRLSGSLKLSLADRDRTRKPDADDKSFAAHLARL